MSRHKFVKNLNLDEELDDFDGGANYEDGDGNDISIEDKSEAPSISRIISTLATILTPIKLRAGQLQEGTTKVREVLGPDVVVTDKEIQESLWHYYYDVEKTINYILNQKTARNRKADKKAEKDGIQASNGKFDLSFCPHSSPGLLPSRQGKTISGLIRSTANFQDTTWSSPRCDATFSAGDYFKDAPWLNIPKDRRGEILIEPLYPPGRLLGGALPQGKVSKIAALAAARKEKGNDTPKSIPQRSTTSVALLDKLSGRMSSTASKDPALSVSETVLPESTGEDLGAPVDVRQSQKREWEISDPQPEVERLVKAPRLLPTSFNPSLPVPVPVPTVAPVATPSEFAKTLFGDSDFWQKRPSVASFQPYYTIPQDPQFTNYDGFAGPSPDDIVLKAQNSKGSKSSKGTTQNPNDNKPLNKVSQRLNNLVIDDNPKAKSKNLDVVAEFGKSNSKNTANFVVIGHVDAGKSTLMGRLLYDLKVVDQRTIDRYRKEAESIGKSSFALAWVLDQGSEERARGVTIDFATNKFETSKTIFTILDAPGHRDFIPNMIAGASQADFAVLVIDASQGNFESGLKGQTKEHALLVRSMGITRMIVAVNKLDTISWSQDRYSEISTQISAFLTAAGFLAKNIAFVPCSGLTGDNIVREPQNSLSEWYTGPTLLSLLESSEPVSRALEKPLRLTINDIFRGGVTNPLSISGRLDAGSVQIGDIVLAMPAAETASIRGIEVDSTSSDWAVAGQNIVLHLSDIEAKHLKPGDIICSPNAPLKNISSFVMKLLAFEHVMPMHVEVHRGRLHTPGRISRLVAVLDKSSGAVVGGGKKVRIVKPGSIARVAVEMDDAVPLEAGARVVLRNGGSTVATGVLE